MRFFVIRIKYLLIALAVAIAIPIICLTSGKTVVTFLTGGREVPIYSVERNDNKIALTFDSAWNDDDIDEIIDTLKSKNCGATFFVTGKWAEQYSASLNKLYRNGFEIGTHSYNHDDYTKMSADEIIRDIEKTENAVMKVTGKKPELMRAPSGAYNDTVVRTVEQSGRKYIQWSVDGIDYNDAAAADIYNRVVSKVNNGDIILLHNGTAHTAEVLPQIIDKLSEKYELVTVSELIYSDNYTIDYSGRQHLNKMY